MKVIFLLSLVSFSMADFKGRSVGSLASLQRGGSGSVGSHQRGGSGLQLGRSGRLAKSIQEKPNSGIDFTGCKTDEKTGFCCIDKLDKITSVEKEPILECTHKNTTQCHYTYITAYTPFQEEVCDDIFEKKCSIVYRKVAYNETVRKCYKPVQKACNGQGPDECRTVYETSCSTKYTEKSAGKFVADTRCEKMPVEICGAGCVFEEGDEECHDKVITSLIELPEETCDLNPQEICRFVTKLVPRLSPVHECTTVPKETCLLKFSPPRQVEKDLQTRWCLDDTPPHSGEAYDEENARADLIQV